MYCVVCVVECCFFLVSGCCLLCCDVVSFVLSAMHVVEGVSLCVVCVFRRVNGVFCYLLCTQLLL